MLRFNTPPLPWPVCLVLAAACCAKGLRRIAAGILLQRLRGHWPGETLGLRAQDIVLPEDASQSSVTAGVWHAGRH